MTDQEKMNQDQKSSPDNLKTSPEDLQASPEETKLDSRYQKLDTKGQKPDPVRNQQEQENKTNLSKIYLLGTPAGKPCLMSGKPTSLLAPAPVPAPIPKHPDEKPSHPRGKKSAASKPTDTQSTRKKPPLATTPGDALFFTGRQARKETEFNQELIDLLGREYFVDAADFAQKSFSDLYLPLDYDFFAELRLHLATQGNLIHKVNNLPNALPTLHPLPLLDYGFLEGMRQKAKTTTAKLRQQQVPGLRHPEQSIKDQPNQLNQPMDRNGRVDMWEARSRELVKKLVQSPSLSAQEKALIQGALTV